MESSAPTLWEWPEKPNRLEKLKQTWFPGCHASIGGSYADAGISNISLAWMISQLEDNDLDSKGNGILYFNDTYLDHVQDSNLAFYNRQTPKDVRPWGFGKLYDSSDVTGLVSAFTSLAPIVRTPGQYTEVSDATGLGGKKPLNRAEERIHRCVRVRIDGGGFGQEEHGHGYETMSAKLLDLAKHAIGLTGIYKPAALKDYTCVETAMVKAEKDHTAVESGVVWKAKGGVGMNLPEDTLGRTEIRLLKRSLENAKL